VVVLDHKRTTEYHCLSKRRTQGGSARSQEEHRVAVLENKGSTGWQFSITRGSTGWQFSITRGAQGGSARSQGEHRVVVLDHKKSTGWQCSITRRVQGGSARSG
jgi:hypothetical protein